MFTRINDSTLNDIMFYYINKNSIIKSNTYNLGCWYLSKNIYSHTIIIFKRFSYEV